MSNDSIVLLMDQKIKKLEEALAFYANPQSYENVQMGSSWMSKVDMDAGSYARSVLKKG